MGDFVQDLGIHDEPEVVSGHVKLDQGPGVTITRDDDHNALVISAKYSPTSQGYLYTLTKEVYYQRCEHTYTLTI